MENFVKKFEKYGKENCKKAYFYNVEDGEGASTISLTTDFGTVRQVDAMIDAYDEYLEYRKGERRAMVDWSEGKAIMLKRQNGRWLTTASSGGSNSRLLRTDKGFTWGHQAEFFSRIKPVPVFYNE